MTRRRSPGEHNVVAAPGRARTESSGFDGATRITGRDAQRLNVLPGEGIAADAKEREHLEELRRELGCAMVVVPGQVPPDVVTMRSRVRVTDLDDGRELEYEIAHPHEASCESRRSRETSTCDAL